MSEELHAPLPPSSAVVWFHCPGSVTMQQKHPDTSDQSAAVEGTAAHWAMMEIIYNRMGAVGQITPAGTVLTQAMIEGAEMVNAEVRRVMAIHPKAFVFCEQRVAIPRVHKDNWGTPDVVIWDEGSQTLYIIDFKFGFGIVEVFENLQLIDYAAGWLTQINAMQAAAGLNAISETELNVVMTIVQPRAFHIDGPVRSWVTTAAKLSDKVFALNMAADEAMGVDPQCKPHPDACEHCTARHACLALQKSAYRSMAVSTRAVSTNMSYEAMGLELRLVVEALQLLEARKSGLQEQIEASMRRGVRVPHWSLSPGQSREKWVKNDAEVIFLGKMLGIDLAKPEEAITPAQAKAKGATAEVIAAYSFRPPAALKLTLDDGADARKVFGS